MAQTGQAGLLWVTVIDLLSQQKFEEALQTAQDVQEKSQQIGIKATEASAATCRAVAEHCQQNSQVLEVLRQLGATWGETALLIIGGAGEASGPWAIAAQNLAQAGSSEVQRLGSELGLCWTETMEARTGSHLTSEVPLQEGELQRIAEKGGPLRAALALKELGRREEAIQRAAAAVKAFRDQGNSEGEATALLCKSGAHVGADNMAALQAANHALKNFRELGHIIGQAASLHAVAKAQLAKRNPDDALNRAAESLRLLRSLGDRCREVSVLRTATEAALALGAVRQALSFGLDALTTCRKLQDRFSEAKVLCLVAKARGACNESASCAAAQEALAIYEELGLKSMQLEALEALAAACKGKQSSLEASTCAGSLAATFQAAGMTKEQSECSYILAKLLHDLQDWDAALAAAQEALANSPQEAGQAKVLSLLSTIYLDRKDFQEALESSQRASAFLGPPQDDEGREIVLTCINNQALAMAQLGSFGEAQQFLEEKLQKFRAEKNKRGEGQALFILAQLLQAKGSTEDALQRLSLAAPALVESRDRRGEALAWQLSAKIHLEKNDLTKALPAAEMSSQAFRKVGDRRGRAQIAAVLAETQFSLCGLEKVNDGNLQEARRAAQESVSLFHDLNERSVEMGYSLHCLANINLALHDWDAALQAAQEALELFRSLQLPLLETTALLLESGAYLGAQDFERSQQRAMEAKEIYNSAGVLKGVDSVDQWLQNLDRYRSGEQTLKTFHGFSMRRKYNAPVSQSDERQNFRAPRRLSAMNDIELWMADDSKVGRSVIIAYQGLEHRAAGGPPPVGKAKVSAELHRLQFPDAKDMEYDVRWVHRRKSKSHSKGRRLQKAEEERLVAK